MQRVDGGSSQSAPERAIVLTLKHKAREHLGSSQDPRIHSSEFLFFFCCCWTRCWLKRIKNHFQGPLPTNLSSISLTLNQTTSLPRLKAGYRRNNFTLLKHTGDFLIWTQVLLRPRLYLSLCSLKDSGLVTHTIAGYTLCSNPIGPVSKQVPQSWPSSHSLDSLSPLFSSWTHPPGMLTYTKLHASAFAPLSIFALAQIP